MENIEQQCAEFRAGFQKLQDEIGKIIVGHAEVVDSVLTCLFANGHCLLEGVPGLGKTLLVRTLSQSLSLDFSRIQFTPDLMPADIIGTNMIAEDAGGRRHFEFTRGPIFANVILADEINRATPKTQSAMLEAMQEHTVTVGGTRYPLDAPFLVMATQNPIEMEGTYPLPEAQLDRFFFKVWTDYPTGEELNEILDRTTQAEEPTVEPVVDGPQVIAWQKLVRTIVAAPHVQDYAVRLIMATHPEDESAADVTKKYVRFGASPRGAQALLLAGKVQALTRERYNVAFEDIRQAALPALRHRILLNFEAQAEGITTDQIVKGIVEHTPTTTDS